MNFCPECGARLAAPARFCPSCGHALATEPTTEPPTEPTTEPTAAPVPAVSTRVLPPPPAQPLPLPGLVDRERWARVPWRELLLSGWVGPAVVGVATALVTGVLALGLALLSKPTDFGLENTLTLAATTAAATWGADLRAGIEDIPFLDDAAGTFHLGAVPLTLTLVAGLVALVLFRRVTAHRTSAPLVLWDALRAGVVLGACVLVPALVLRTENDELGRGWGAALDEDSLGLRASVGADGLGSFFMPLLLLTLLLVLAAATRAELWPERLRSGHAYVDGAVRAAGVWLLASPLVGLLGLLAIGLLGEENDTDPLGPGATRAVAAAVIGFVANAGIWFSAIGVGAPVSFVGRATGEPVERDSARLWGEVTDQEPGLWVTPVLALVLLVVLALLVVRWRRRRQEDAGRALAAWVVSLLVVVPSLVRLASVHGRGSFSAEDEEYTASFLTAPDGLQSTVLLVVVAALVALAVALATGALSPQAVRSAGTSVRASLSPAGPGAPVGQPGHPGPDVPTGPVAAAEHQRPPQPPQEP